MSPVQRVVSFGLEVGTHLEGPGYTGENIIGFSPNVTMNIKRAREVIERRELHVLLVQEFLWFETYPRPIGK